jgi:hypothetical protein
LARVKIGLNHDRFSRSWNVGLWVPRQRSLGAAPYEVGAEGSPPSPNNFLNSLEVMLSIWLRRSASSLRAAFQLDAIN